MSTEDGVANIKEKLIFFFICCLETYSQIPLSKWKVRQSLLVYCPYVVRIAETLIKYIMQN